MIPVRRTKSLLLVLTILVFAGGVALVTVPLRARIRAEILGRDGSILDAVAQREAGSQGEPLLGPVLGAVELDGVIGVRIFDPDGKFLRALPDNLVSGRLDPGALREGRPVSCFLGNVALPAIYTDPFGDLGDDRLPIVRVILPVRGREKGQIKGYAEFLLDGRPTAEAFRRLDHDLLIQSGGVFLGGGLLIVAILLLSMRRLTRKNLDLAAANRELALHAKTAAIGAITSHLFHRLKNVVSGLHLAIDGPGDPLADARTGTQQIARLIQDVINVLRDGEQGIAYDLTAIEMLELVRTGTQSLADARGIRVDVSADGDVRLPSRYANLMLFVIENLLRNAVEASGPGQRVECRFQVSGGECRFIVSDCGPGIPEGRRAHLFEPGASSKSDGSGIGLSISRQICRHMGGHLRLLRTGPDGTAFELSVPRNPESPESEAG